MSPVSSAKRATDTRVSHLARSSRAPGRDELQRVTSPLATAPSPSPGTVPGGWQPARPWQRGLGWLIDVAPFVGLALLAARGLKGQAALSALVHALWSKNIDGAALGLRLPAAGAGIRIAALAGVLLLIAAAWVGYRIAALPLAGRTLGKLIVGARVVSFADPARKPTWGQSARRWLVPQAAGLVPLPGTGLLPCLWLLRDPARRGVHDHLAGTVVIRSSGA